ncbi:MAG TPA: SGNH/GDSL hydrolase family protein [Planctomycetota bacterium]|nr:SGNH/GDSL hydrolase family protein [Planctomycetota bacterium]
MSSARTRLAVLLVSSACAAGAGWIAWRSIQARRQAVVQLHVAPRPADAAPISGPAKPEGTTPAELLPRDPKEWRYYLSVAQASKLYAITNDPLQVYDPWVYCRDVGNVTLEMHWKEHPAGKFTWKTNSLGCREDHELAVPPADLRVLVAGDSHTCGLCNDDESYPNLLETSIKRARGGKSVEVLNAALGGYSFYNYLGTLLRLRDFEPQVFVVGIFGGNDFNELLPLYLPFHGKPWTALSKEQEARRARGLAVSPDAMGQGFATLDAFRNFPREEELALRGSLEMCAEIQRTASACGARLVVVYIPSPFELGSYESDERVPRIRRALELSEADLGLLPRLSDSLTSGLREQGIELIDMRKPFAAEPEPPYWKEDFHLNLRGHKLIAQALEPLVTAKLR